MVMTSSRMSPLEMRCNVVGRQACPALADDHFRMGGVAQHRKGLPRREGNTEDPGDIGPYLRNFPPNPLVGENATAWVADNLGSPTLAGDGSEGWALKIVQNRDVLVGYINATQNGLLFP